MRLAKKRTWSTALGDPKPSPDLLGTLNISPPTTDHRSSTATVVTPGAFRDDHEFEASAVIFPGGCIRTLLDGSEDVNSLESGTRPLEAAAELTPRNQELNQHLWVDNETLHETPISSVSGLHTFSTPPSIEEVGTSVDASQATLVCYGQVRCVSVSLLFTAHSL
jgi:hypothetical protein